MSVNKNLERWIRGLVGMDGPGGGLTDFFVEKFNGGVIIDCISWNCGPVFRVENVLSKYRIYRKDWVFVHSVYAQPDELQYQGAPECTHIYT